MAKLSAEELIEAFKEMTLIELSEFVKQFEEVFDVTAAAPAAVAVAAAPAAGDAAAEEEKSEFEVVLESAGDKKIAVVKVVKNLTGLGLKEAKDLVDGAPSTIFENAKKEDAEKAKAEIEEAGGSVTLK
ncbi:50S ribosomal protein L7/L12 [Schaalia canis]|uniref:Large ribosomal subunit protein bL12 n=1 Tax=Schaalia canis TaxID=100469 RepID=A0A3P1SFY0_9ACTO|nr:50S ribosomal protein L7/L12 [Schaalia canis]RRC95655.1 50S ribosomal protein L7/L12 [Schaalia canis]